jgi:hypothetical protein
VKYRLCELYFLKQLNKIRFTKFLSDYKNQNKNASFS